MVTPRKKRYKVPGGRTRPANLHIKLTDKEKGQIESFAAGRRMTISAFARQALFAYRAQS